MQQIIMLLTCVLLSACQQQSTRTTEQPTLAQADTRIASQPKANTVTVIGHITYQHFEGGFFALDGDNGSKYLLSPLTKTYKHAGLRVKVTGVVLTDIMSTTQYGQALRIHSIEVLPGGKKQTSPYPKQ